MVVELVASMVVTKADEMAVPSAALKAVSMVVTKVE